MECLAFQTLDEMIGIPDLSGLQENKFLFGPRGSLVSRHQGIGFCKTSRFT